MGMASAVTTAKFAPSPGRLTPNSGLAASAQPGGRTRESAPTDALATCPGPLMTLLSGTPLTRPADACRDSVPQRATSTLTISATDQTQELATDPAIASRAGPKMTHLGRTP